MVFRTGRSKRSRKRWKQRNNVDPTRISRIMLRYRTAMMIYNIFLSDTWIVLDNTVRIRPAFYLRYISELETATK